MFFRNSEAYPRSMHWLLLIPFFFSASELLAEDWPHWRGPDRNDITSEKSGWKGGSWPGKRLWKRNVGVGCGSPIVVDGCLYALGWKNNRDYLQCLDARNGNVKWEQAYRCPLYGRRSTGDKGQYAGPSSTPEYDTETGYIYTLSTDGDLNCWNTKQRGKKVWGINFYQKYNVRQRPAIGGRSRLRDYGYTTAPLVFKDWLLAEVGAPEGTVMAFDKRTGRRLWVSQLKDHAGHTGGLVPMQVGNIPCVAVLTHQHLAVIRLDEGNAGKTVAKYFWETHFANSIATPAVYKNYVLITSSYNHGTICKLQITNNKARRIWEKNYASGVCSPIIYKGKIYWAWNRARCLDFESGKQLWNGGKFGSPGSCIITGDGKLIIWGGSGQLVLAETAEKSPSQYKVLAQNRVTRSIAWPHVVLADGRIFCKERRGTIFCFDIP